MCVCVCVCMYVLGVCVQNRYIKDMLPGNKPSLSTGSFLDVYILCYTLEASIFFISFRSMSAFRYV